MHTLALQLNFDGDLEFFVSLPAGATWTVDTFEVRADCREKRKEEMQHTLLSTHPLPQGHPWRLVDATTGKTLQTYIATAGEQVLRIGMQTADVRDSPSKRRPLDAAPGFDGLGGTSTAYATAQVRHTPMCCLYIKVKSCHTI